MSKMISLLWGHVRHLVSTAKRPPFPVPRVPGGHDITRWALRSTIRSDSSKIRLEDVAAADGFEQLAERSCSFVLDALGPIVRGFGELCDDEALIERID